MYTMVAHGFKPSTPRGRGSYSTMNSAPAKAVCFVLFCFSLKDTTYGLEHLVQMTVRLQGTQNPGSLRKYMLRELHQYSESEVTFYPEIACWMLTEAILSVWG